MPASRPHRALLAALVCVVAHAVAQAPEGVADGDAGWPGRMRGASAASTRPAPPAADFTLYHRTDDLLDFFRRAALDSPGMITYETVPDPAGSGVSLPVVTISASSHASAPTAVLVAGGAAGDLVTAEMALWIGAVLAGGSSNPAAQAAGRWHRLQAAAAEAEASGWSAGAEGALPAAAAAAGAALCPPPGHVLVPTASDRAAAAAAGRVVASVLAGIAAGGGRVAAGGGW